MNNLPPGCNSADGGIDHAYESALETLTDAVPNPIILKLLTDLAPFIETIYDSGYQDGARDATQMFTDEDQTI